MKPQVYQTSTDYEVNAIIHALEAFKLFLVMTSQLTISKQFEINCTNLIMGNFLANLVTQNKSLLYIKSFLKII